MWSGRRSCQSNRVGVEHVYDLTVEGLHSFVANGIIVHNCVYQEQVIQILADVAGYTPGEADLVRRGISKKSKKTLDEHREIFAQGSKKKSGLKREEADAIWDALMGFARYGFNRAHAADYAVIVAQTAFLKAYYPAEYMAALLTVERHDTEKVGVLIAECRRMGIEVLPPNVNVSGHNFSIEQLPPDRPAPHRAAVFPFPVPERTAIRMGLDAIKNVGEGPIDTILNARGDRPFASLAEFADRVDLRQVNRRGLECLIKVGALDDFGERGQLLAGIDRIMSASEVTHVAREVGQLTLFGGADADGAEELLASLPAAAKANPKEALDWEKELVGVYVSSHPLQKMTVDLMNVITHASVDVTEEVAGKGVVVAGIVADVRQITTKKGETMAFVRLEDLQGTIDVTVFPRLYADEKALFALEKIIIVAGKADVRNGRVSVVADTVRDYVEGMKVIEDTSSVAYRFRNGAAGVPTRPQVKERQTTQSYAAPARAYAPPPTIASGDEDEDAYSGDDNPFAAEEPAWMGERETGRRGDKEIGRQGDRETRGSPVGPSATGSQSEPQGGAHGAGGAGAPAPGQPHRQSCVCSTRCCAQACRARDHAAASRRYPAHPLGVCGVSRYQFRTQSAIRSPKSEIPPHLPPQRQPGRRPQASGRDRGCAVEVPGRRPLRNHRGGQRLGPLAARLPEQSDTRVQRVAGGIDTAVGSRRVEGRRVKMVADGIVQTRRADGELICYNRRIEREEWIEERSNVSPDDPKEYGANVARSDRGKPPRCGPDVGHAGCPILSLAADRCSSARLRREIWHGL